VPAAAKLDSLLRGIIHAKKAPQRLARLLVPVLQRGNNRPGFQEITS